MWELNLLLLGGALALGVSGQCNVDSDLVDSLSNDVLVDESIAEGEVVWSYENVDGYIGRVLLVTLHACPAVLCCVVVVHKPQFASLSHRSDLLLGHPDAVPERHPPWVYGERHLDGLCRLRESNIARDFRHIGVHVA